MGSFHDVYVFGAFRLDARERVLWRHGHPVPLTPKAIEILIALVTRHGHIVEKAELMQSVWPEVAVEESNLSQHIYTLRKVLGQADDGRSYIETVPRRGYRLVVPVREVLGDPPSAGGAQPLTEPSLAAEDTGEPALAWRSEEPDADPPNPPGGRTGAARPVGSGREGDVTSVRSRRILRTAAATVVLVAVASGFWLGKRWEDRDVAAIPLLRNAVQVTATLEVESYPTWAPDGLRLAYQASAGGYPALGNHDIWVAQLGGGEPVNLTEGSPANDRMPSWSPDGREIAFVSDRDGAWGVYTLPSIGGIPRKLLALPRVDPSSWSAPRWSTDGTQLLVLVRQADENVVIVLSLHSLDTTRVVLPGHEGNLCWDLSVRPDGRRFAYVEGGSSGTEVTRLWTIPASGGAAAPLTDGLTNVWSPTWSADGRKVFYVSNRGGSMDLWQQAVAEDGSALAQPIAVTHGLGIRSAAFSPDGSRLAYTRGGMIGNVWRVPMHSGQPATWADATQLTFDLGHIEFVDVSPDGALLAISSDRRGNQDLWLLPATGGQPIPLTTDSTPDWNPRWSPDGREIAFVAYRSGNRDIWVMPSRGGPARQLTSHPGQDRYPSWSPDGSEIVFQSVGTAATLVVGVDGGEPRPVAPGVRSSAEWSPDGQWLLVERHGKLHRMARDGHEAVLLPSTGAYASARRFSRDGNSILYSVVTGPRENHDIWKLALADGKVSRLTKLDGRRGRLGYGFSADATYLYITWHEDAGDIWAMDVITDVS